MNPIVYQNICTCLFSFFTFSLLAQVNLGSLHNNWQDELLSDSSRVKAMETYIKKGFLNSQADSAYVLTEQIIDFSTKRDYPSGIAMAYHLKGRLYTNSADYSEALIFLKQSLDISKKIGDQMTHAKALNSMGIIYRKLGENRKALEFYEKSLNIREKINDPTGIASSLNNIGVIYRMQKENAKALEFYQRSLKIRRTLGLDEGIAGSLNNIANIYKSMGENSKALEHYEQSLVIKQKIGNQVGYANTLSNIGSFFRQQKKYAKALDYHERSLLINQKMGNQGSIASNLNDVGSTYFKQKKYSKSIEFCTKGLKIAKNIGTPNHRRASCSCLYKNYKSIGNSEKALFYLEKKNKLDRNLQSEETSQYLQKMEFQKQLLSDSLLQEEEQLITKMAHEKELSNRENTRNIFIAIGALFLLVIIGLYNRMRYVNQSKKEIEKARDRSDNLLLNILPSEIAKELKETGEAQVRNFNKTSILFTDFKDFTQTSETLSPTELVEELNVCFKAFDNITTKYQVEKIKTIGDAYMAVGGLPVASDASVKNTVLAALEMLDFIEKRKNERYAEGFPHFEMRVGIHTGPVVAGIVGVKKFQYDIWGDTVNTASRMESNGEVGKVNISESTYQLLKEDPEFKFQNRGMIEAKGKGKISMWYVSRNSKG